MEKGTDYKNNIGQRKNYNLNNIIDGGFQKQSNNNYGPAKTPTKYTNGSNQLNTNYAKLLFLDQLLKSRVGGLPGGYDSKPGLENFLQNYQKSLQSNAMLGTTINIIYINNTNDYKNNKAA